MLSREITIDAPYVKRVNKENLSTKAILNAQTNRSFHQKSIATKAAQRYFLYLRTAFFQSNKRLSLKTPSSTKTAFAPLARRGVDKNAPLLLFVWQIVDGFALLYRQVTATYGKRAVGNVLVHRGATGDKTIVAYCERRNQICVATDKTVFSDGRSVFCFAVVVDEDHSATDICVFAHESVANVRKVACLYSV